MTAALECAKCGHSVTLYEKEPALGPAQGSRPYGVQV
ncbi:MAG: hypothetical protein ACLRNW_08955 [Neglectibacter sp.]